MAGELLLDRMAGEISVEVPSLYKLSLNRICDDLNIIAKLNPHTGLYELRPRVFLTENIVSDFLSELAELGVTLHDGIMHMFRCPSSTRLRRVNLTNSDCSAATLRWITLHHLTHLDLTNWQVELSSTEVKDTLPHLLSSLQVLILGQATDEFLNACMHIFPTPDQHIDGCPVDVEIQRKILHHKRFEAPHLRHLSISGPYISCAVEFSLPRLFIALQQLKVLEIIGPIMDRAKEHVEVSRVLCLIENYVPELVSLSLLDCIPAGTPLSSYSRHLYQLAYLRHLDISVTYVELNEQPELLYPDHLAEDEQLYRLVSKLKNLTSLDISGTHLAGLGESYRESSMRPPGSLPVPIRGLRDRHLSFLGVLHCRNNAALRGHLPADTVSGEGSIEHILEALQSYQRRYSFICEVMRVLFQKVKVNLGVVKEKTRCLRLVCDIMRFHMKKSVNLQISCSAVMYYLLASIYAPPADPITIIDESYVINTLVKSSKVHLFEPSLQKNVLIILNYLPAHVWVVLWTDVCERLIDIIEGSQAEENQYSRLSILVLNSLACHIKQEQKREAGDLGVIRTMLWLIKMKVEHHISDSTAELAWSVLWNITDETPANCRRFLMGEGEQPGLDLFLACYNRLCVSELTVPENEGAGNNGQEALLRNMMGLLGNVAEVTSLRKRFLHKQYINIFRKLLSSHQDGIEVSYNAAGIIAHLASDGPGIEWGSDAESCVIDPNDSIPYADEDEPESMEATSSPFQLSTEHKQAEETEVSPESTALRNDILLDLKNAIQRWPLESTRTINYRSFKPITRLLFCEHTSAVRYWAIWAMCNLTNTVPSKYCQLLEDEGSVHIIQELFNNEKEVPAIRKLAEKVLQNYAVQRQAMEDV